jgi:hypothetical protein
LLEDREVFQALVATGALPRSIAGEAPDNGRVVVGLLDDDETDFVGEEAAQPFEAFLRHAYLMTVEADRLALADAQPLYDLLAAALPGVRDRVPVIRRDDLLKQYRLRPGGYYQAPSALIKGALDAVKRGASYCGMFSVCPRDGEPLCFSTYAWMVQGVCLLMATYDGRLSLELFPFRLEA